MSDINEYGELAEWDTTSRQYRKKIRKLTRHHRWYPVASAMQCYHVGLMTWEQARAELGIKSDPNDPRWGRFFVPWDSPKRKENND